jgi:hypothetical protein
VGGSSGTPAPVADQKQLFENYWADAFGILQFDDRGFLNEHGAAWKLHHDLFTRERS